MVSVKHLGLPAGMAEVALLTGDPERVPMISHALGGRHLTSRRGFECHVADGLERPLAIVSTGIGGPSTAIVAEELIELGVRALIRIGTCGALQPEIIPHDLVVASGCVRDEGTSRAYVDLAFPALAHPELHWQLTEAARRTGATVHTGITHCKDAYYSEQPGKQPDPLGWGRRWAMLRAAGVLATEMEAAPLFVIGSLRRVPVAALFVSVGKDDGCAGFDEAFNAAVTAATAAFAVIARNGVLDAVPLTRNFSGVSYLARSRSSGSGEAE